MASPISQGFCDAIDPDKKLIGLIAIKDEEIHICDSCPILPQKHLENVHLGHSSDAAIRYAYNLSLAQCYGHCHRETICVAVSYNKYNSTCNLFSSTAGSFVEDKKWSTVLLIQPTGLIQSWRYTRHTRIRGHQIVTTSQPNFFHCLDECNQHSACNIVGYSFLTQNCSLFKEADDVLDVDLAYGYLSGVRVHEKDDIANRFVLEGITIKESLSDRCKTFSGITTFTRDCYINGGPGCDQISGCTSCIVPVRGNDERETQFLNQCFEIRQAEEKNIKKIIRQSLEPCLLQDNCIGVGYKLGENNAILITLDTYIKRKFDIKYLLKFPNDKGREFLEYYDIVPNAVITDSLAGNIAISKGASFFKCLTILRGMREFSSLSYLIDEKLCKLGNSMTGININNGLAVTLLKKPSLISNTIRFTKTPGFQIVSQNERAVYSVYATGDSEEICTKRCNVNYKDWCKHVSITISAQLDTCKFFDADSAFKLNPDEHSTVFSKDKAMYLSLESLNNLDLFDSAQLSNCFLKPKTIKTLSKTKDILNNSLKFGALGKSYENQGSDNFKARLNEKKSEKLIEHFEPEVTELELLSDMRKPLVQVQNCGKRIVGYMSSWGSKIISDSQLKRLTHLIYPLELFRDGTIRHFCEQSDSALSYQRQKSFLNAAQRYPHLKVQFAVGGRLDSKYLSDIVSSPAKRSIFISSVIEIIRKYDLDGVDILWQHPAREEIGNYGVLLAELRKEFDWFRKDLLISFFGGAGSNLIDDHYLKSLLKYADYINILSFDYNGEMETSVPFYNFGRREEGWWTVKHYACKTLQPHKINMGVPFYGRSWGKVGPFVGEKNGMWQFGSESTVGDVTWYDIQANFINNSNFSKFFNQKSKSPFALNLKNNNMYLAYEDQRSLKYKMDFAMVMNVGGVMIMNVDYDDDDLNLLNVVYEAFSCNKTNILNCLQGAKIIND